MRTLAPCGCVPSPMLWMVCSCALQLEGSIKSAQHLFSRYDMDLDGRLCQQDFYDLMLELNLALPYPDYQRFVDASFAYAGACAAATRVACAAYSGQDTESITCIVGEVFQCWWFCGCRRLNLHDPLECWLAVWCVTQFPQTLTAMGGCPSRTSSRCTSPSQRCGGPSGVKTITSTGRWTGARAAAAAAWLYVCALPWCWLHWHGLQARVCRATICSRITLVVLCAVASSAALAAGMCRRWVIVGLPYAAVVDQGCGLG
eukprot:GHRQ01028040.1.p1 GENE.GHRQ01028040.1~~GHRQ01028040.1.p1  ORF type:complete len:259 (-),score=37.95 GHRQ01028040.1:535-1311(-)